MWEQILPGLRIKIFMTIILGVAYPLAMTGISQAIFHKQANGSLITAGNKIIGSELIGQTFSKPEYFHPRPSSAGAGYDATASGGSNLGPTSAKLLQLVSVRLVHYCLENHIPYESSKPLDEFKDSKGDLDDVKLIKAFNDNKSPLVFTAKSPIPADAVTGSSSGLDPHISPANAQAQVVRVAKARGVTPEQIQSLASDFTEPPTLAVLGEPRVNTLRLNLALDHRFPLTH